VAQNVGQALQVYEAVVVVVAAVVFW